MTTKKATRTPPARAARAAAPAPATASAPAAPAAARTLKVRATQDGYYGDKLRRTGDVFEIDAAPSKTKGGTDPALFSSKWMERVDPTTPDSITSNNEVLRRQHDETLTEKIQGKAAGGAPSTGDSDVI